MIVRCLIPKLRAERNWSQAELARRSGLSRQLIHNLENGSTMPSIQTAFQLKSAFACKFEELFEELEPTPEADVPVRLADKHSSNASRVHLAKISNEWIAYDADTEVSLTSGFSSADAVLKKSGKKLLATPLIPIEEVETNLSIAGCDPALQLIRDTLARTSKIKVILKPANSSQSVNLLHDGLVHIAGIHYTFHDLKGNLRSALSQKNPDASQSFRFSVWEQGWAVAKGNPKKISSIDDLTRKNIRIVNREAGSGTRMLLDHLLKQASIKPSQLRGYEKIVHSHLACAQAVSTGSADAALTLRAIAVALGLDFLPISRVSFDLVIPKKWMHLPSIQILGNTLQSKKFQKNLASLPGYNSEKTGDSLD